MSNNTATIKTRKNLVSTRTITMTALLAAIESIICTNGSVRFTCTDWGICVWTGYRSDDRTDKKYITASVNINRRNW